MSVHIKINDWFGADQGDATSLFTKVFRMTDSEGESAMSLICRNKSWQFEHQTSDDQSNEAQGYLTSIGFDVELVPLSDIDWDSDDGIGFDDAAGDYGKSADRKLDDPKKKQKTALALILILVLAGVGLTQTQQGKDLTSTIGSKSKELLAGFGMSSDSDKDATSTKPAADIKPIERIAIDGAPTFPMTLSGCVETRAQMTQVLQRADLDQTQSVEVCKDKTISNPAGEWKCEFKSLSKICNNLEAYSCAMEYQCVTETPAYNRELFKKQIEALS
jgi:hypothetical protein